MVRHHGLRDFAPRGHREHRDALARSGENVILAHSGWGDGVYPLLQTLDADGRLTGVHIDLQVVGSPPKQNRRRRRPAGSPA